MNYIIAGKNIELTDALKSKIEEKFERLEKYFIREVEVTVTLRVEKLEQIIEVMIPMKGKTLRAEVKDQDMYAAIDLAVDVLEKQLVKYKSKLKDHHKKIGEVDTPFTMDYINGEVEVESEIKIERRKKIDLRPMYEDEAILQMELLGHDFFVFINAETDKYAVVYKRKKDHFGIIEAQ